MCGIPQATAETSRRIQYQQNPAAYTYLLVCKKCLLLLLHVDT